MYCPEEFKKQIITQFVNSRRCNSNRMPADTEQDKNTTTLCQTSSQCRETAESDLFFEFTDNYNYDFSQYIHNNSVPEIDERSDSSSENQKSDQEEETKQPAYSAYNLSCGDATREKRPVNHAAYVSSTTDLKNPLMIKNQSQAQVTKSNLTSFARLRSLSAPRSVATPTTHLIP